LLQLFLEAFGKRTPAHSVWEKDGRFYDALRPGVEPNGFGSIEELRALRHDHLRRVFWLFRRLDVLVFTLGLTEAWTDVRDGTVYPIAPGVIAGKYIPENHKFRNFRYDEIYADMKTFLGELRKVNPSAKLLLTVSPVPLAATASNQHVLVATT